jgi:hypothetical protein
MNFSCMRRRVTGLLQLSLRGTSPSPPPPTLIASITSLLGIGVQRQRLWEQIRDLSNGGFLAHRNAMESGEDQPATPKNHAKLTEPL